MIPEYPSPKKQIDHKLTTIDHKLTAEVKVKKAAQSMMWEGRKIRLALHRGAWRARCRTEHLTCDILTPTGNLADAKKFVKERLDTQPAASTPKSKCTVQDLAAVYLVAPKRCSADIARRNVVRMKSVCRDGFGKPMDEVRLAQLPDLWPAYVAARQKLPLPDYATRRPINRGINSAMRQAAGLLVRGLASHYERHGLVLPADAGRLLLAAESPKVPATADDAALVQAWRALRDTDIDMWLAVGLARFAGLRQQEIFHFRGKWTVVKDGATYVRLQDRPEDDWQTKTGIPYSALVLDVSLAEYLRAMDPEARAITCLNTYKWIQRRPQEWLKVYTGDAKAPLHRLRGLYADQVKRETEAAILARRQGIEAASRNLGHTTTATTEDHYLQSDSPS
jgi:hypothetical protein